MMDKRIISFDFETYYDSDYSLRKLTYEEYIRDPRFEITALTAHTSDDDNLYCVEGAEQSKQLLQFLGYERKDTISIAHNNRFDASIASWRLGLHAGMSLCSILLMRATGINRLTNQSLKSLAELFISCGYQLPQKGTAIADASGLRLADLRNDPKYFAEYLDYAKTDTLILKTIAPVLINAVSEETMKFIDLSIKMTSEPVFRLDSNVLTKYLNEYRADRDAKLLEASQRLGIKNAEELLGKLRSKTGFAELIENLNVKVPKKKSVAQTKTLNAKYEKILKASEDGNEKSVKVLNKFVTECLNNPLVEVSNKDGSYIKYDYDLSKSSVEFQQLSLHPNKLVATLADLRSEFNSSITESRTDRLLGISQRGWLPFSLEYASAHTYRYGGTDKTNLQNLPKRSGNTTLRSSICAPNDDYIIVACDSSQIEARLLSYVVGDNIMLNIFATGGDPYAHQASSIYQYDMDVIKVWAKARLDPSLPDDHPDVVLHKRCKYMRNMGKEAVLASGYQMSGKTFGERLKQSKIMLQPTEEQLREAPTHSGDELDEWLDEFHFKEAKRINAVYRAGHPEVVNYWKFCENILANLVVGNSGYFGGPNNNLFYYDGNHKILGRRIPGIMLPNGTWLLYKDLHQQHNPETGFLEYRYTQVKDGREIPAYIYGGKLTENLVQALAFALLIWQAVKINDYVPVKLNVHDEFGSVCLKSQLKEVENIYTYFMKQVPDWLIGCPVDCEFTYGDNYGDC